MLQPVVDRTSAGIADEELDFNQRGDELARLAIPIGLSLDVVVGQSGEVASPALLASPQEQTDERPASFRPKQLLKPLGLAMPAETDRDANVVCHASMPPSRHTRVRAGTSAA